MDSKVNYTVVGLFIVILGTALVIALLWLTTLKHDQVYKTYLIYLHEEVSGLSEQSSVRYNGVKVGYVSHLELNPSDPQQVKVTVKIVAGTPVTTSTIAVLTAQGITGIDYIGLKALTPDAPALQIKPGERYPVIPSEPSLLVKLSASLEEVTQSVTKLSKNIEKVFDKKNRTLLTESLTNIQTTTAALAKNSENISQTLQSARVLMENGAEASKQLPSVLTNLNTTLDAITGVANTFTSTGNSVTKTMETTRATIQNVSQQLMPATQQLILRLNGVATNIQQFSSQLNRNPSMLIRGKTQPALGPGER